MIELGLLKAILTFRCKLQVYNRAECPGRDYMDNIVAARGHHHDQDAV